MATVVKMVEKSVNLILNWGQFKGLIRYFIRQFVGGERSI